ncbi:gamma carbonic anhydrase family protein [Salinarchaeum laminariae]|uniref:gamma carbonic anhydrase family protein n=1 Tax=Salinarchaeum laminariae TaxID=869888 RepID=UPI0020C03F2A|nr:gamma carbonic anhydrase family protein [Salinarchaeum laminariae]
MDSRSYAFEGSRPTIDDDAHVSKEATLVGDVTIAANASVWPCAVLRGDVGPVEIGESAHVGDGAVLHASSAAAEAMIGHGAVLNDATVGEGALVGFNATLNSDVELGAGSVVASGSVVPAGWEIPEDSFVRGVPAQVTPIEETSLNVDGISERYASGTYSDLAGRHEELFEA